MALAYLKNTDSGEIIAVEKPSARYDELTTDVVNAGVSGRNTPSNVPARWGEISLGGGSSAQVFEVTDLTIPAGTDWSNSEGHQLGQLTGLVEGHAIGFKFWFETLVDDADIAAGTQQHLLLMVSEVRSFYDTNNYAYFQASGSLRARTVADTSLGNQDGGLAVAMNDAEGGTQARLKAGASGTDLWQNEELVRGHAPPDPAYVGLYTDGPLPTDIHIVRARAAFLVI